MQIVRRLVILVIAAAIAVPASAVADGRHVIDQAAITAAVTAQVEHQTAERAAIRDALAQPEVRDMAVRMGLDMVRATNAVNALSGDDLARAASAARQVNQQLVGGASTVVISTTTIIIALLVVILLIVALK
jgi:hypothetical protein